TLGGLIGIPYALSSLVGLHTPNYFERTLEPVVAHPVPTGEGAPTAGAEKGAGDARWLSPPPPKTDGASPLSVGEGSQGEPVAEREPSPEEISRERLFTIISVIIAAIGIGLGWLIYQRRPL